MAGIKERNGGLCTRAVCGHYSACFTEGPIKVSVFGFDEVGMMLFSIAKDSARDFNDVKKSPRGGGGQFKHARHWSVYPSSFLSIHM